MYKGGEVQCRWETTHKDAPTTPHSVLQASPPTWRWTLSHLLESGLGRDLLRPRECSRHYGVILGWARALLDHCPSPGPLSPPQREAGAAAERWVTPWRWAAVAEHGLRKPRQARTTEPLNEPVPLHSRSGHLATVMSTPPSPRQSARAAITEHHRPGAWNNRHLLSHSLEAGVQDQRASSQLLAGATSSLQTATLSP